MIHFDDFAVLLRDKKDTYYNVEFEVLQESQKYDTKQPEL